MNTQTKQEVAPQRPSLRQSLEAATSEFARALPPHIPVEKFARTIQTSLSTSPQVARAAMSTDYGMRSLLSACTKAAQDGLVIDGREAALTVFNSKVKTPDGKDAWVDMVQYIPMVRGLMKLARNSGQIEDLNAEVVFAKDFFRQVKGDNALIEHVPYDGGPDGDDEDNGPAVRVYAIAKLKGGEVHREVMSKAQVMRIAAQSKNAGQYNAETGKNYEEWWRKCVLRRISKYLPSSSDRDDFNQAVTRMDEDFDFNQDEQPPVRHAGKTRGGAAAALRNITPPKGEAAAQALDRAKDEAVKKDTRAQSAKDETVDPDTGEVLDDADYAPRPDDMI